MISNNCSKVSLPNRNAIMIYVFVFLFGFLQFSKPIKGANLKTDLLDITQDDNRLQFYYLWENNYTDCIYEEKENADDLGKKTYFPLLDSLTIDTVMNTSKIGYTDSQNIKFHNYNSEHYKNFTLVWSDEFDGNTLNTDNWTFSKGDSGWGNNELQNYTSGDNTKIVDGKLVITAKKVDDHNQVGSYTSARISTKGKQDFQYGRIEIRAKLPSGKCIWPAIWMLGSSISSIGWPECGEIDIMEYVCYQPDVVHSTVHTTAGSGGNSDGNSITLSTCEEEFHIYGLSWTKEQLVFYADSIENIIHVYSPVDKNKNNWPFNKPAYLILNIAVGGNWGGNEGVDNKIFPQTMEVDYVRVYKRDK